VVGVVWVVSVGGGVSWGAVSVVVGTVTVTVGWVAAVLVGVGVVWTVTVRVGGAGLLGPEKNVVDPPAPVIEWPRMRSGIVKKPTTMAKARNPVISTRRHRGRKAAAGGSA
jgi:hypothetical protein